MDNKKKVVFLITKFDGHYAPYYVELIKRLGALGYAVTMCYLRGLPLEKGGEPWRALYMEEITGIGAGFFSKLKALRGILKAEDADVLHCHRHEAAMYGAFASFSFPRMRVVSHVHGMRRSRNLKRRLANVFINSRLSGIVAISEAVKKDIVDNNFFISSDKVSVAYNGIVRGSVKSSAEDRVKARKLLGIRDNEFAFVTAGRLMPTKGQRYLVEAFAAVSKKFTATKLFIAGKGELETELKALVEQLGISGRVEFLGYREDLPEILCGFDCFVFPSVMEGLGLALIEAMSAGVFAIASDVGGIPEVVGINGLLVPPKNAGELEKAMFKVLNMKQEERESMVDAGRKRAAELFTTDAMANAFAAVYEKAVRI